jgi:hypothetical protein
MKKIATVAAILFFCTGAGEAVAMDKDLDRSQAMLHEFVAGIPAGVEVTVPYRKVINLKRLHKDELAYWNPHNDKYIVDGDNSYLWCVIYKKNHLNPTHHWIAMETAALTKAKTLNRQFAGGVAFFQLRLENKKMMVKAFPYTTVHAMMEDKPVTTIPE